MPSEPLPEATRRPPPSGRQLKGQRPQTAGLRRYSSALPGCHSRTCLYRTQQLTQEDLTNTILYHFPIKNRSNAIEYFCFSLSAAVFSFCHSLRHYTFGNPFIFPIQNRPADMSPEALSRNPLAASKNTYLHEYASSITDSRDVNRNREGKTF